MIRVLVVDDDFMVARVNRDYVERVPGFTVVGEAHTGTAALDAVERLRPDLVLLDIYLPDLSGLEVLRRLRTHQRVPVDVLAVTAARGVDAVREAMQGGVVHYLIKPFTFAALRERLDRYADARRRLEHTGEAGQDEVDQLFGSLHAPGNRPLPKGLSAATCDVVAGVLDDAGDELSAAATAARAGLSRVSARRYLEYLVDTGRAQLRLQYGGAGRPEHRYRTTSEES
ncbi:two-component system CitB family response regulator [Halopolyspora algeriensis]|uniref:Transcriptional regulatory protein n=1 Tax=Halopolyspora algeriensis TaxID=1500506 RepID=A0A368VI97_9ACTN|nr:response regulator [Halopolyspora algeriensis]RCW40931.1 two-component system CitB family response regulator [Halopolyspora algeriensis]TQM53983.1 two-component system CitB family response regulator [Halopolyspora algeriensis]